MRLIVVGLLFLASPSQALNETGNVQPVNIKSGETVSVVKVSVGQVPVKLFEWNPKSGKKSLVVYAGAKEVWIGSSTVIAPHNGYPVFLKDQYESNNSAAIYGVVETGTAIVYTIEEQ